MRKFLLIFGIIFIATTLITLAYTDTQLRILLFGLPQTFNPSPSSRGGAQLAITSTALLQQMGYIRVISYLVGAIGLALIIIGLSLPSKVNKEIEAQATQETSQPPPWESFETPKEGANQ